MQHFVNDDKFNFFRLPVGWQYLLNNNLGGVSFSLLPWDQTQDDCIQTLDPTNFAKYDSLVQSCLATGAHCIIGEFNSVFRFCGWLINLYLDIHKYEFAFLQNRLTNIFTAMRDGTVELSVRVVPLMLSSPASGHSLRPSMRLNPKSYLVP